MKKLSAMPKVRLVLYSIFAGMGLYALVLVIMNEFIIPHDPKEPIWARLLFLVYALILVFVATGGVISSIKEIFILRINKKRPT